MDCKIIDILDYETADYLVEYDGELYVYNWIYEWFQTLKEYLEQGSVVCTFEEGVL